MELKECINIMKALADSSRLMILNGLLEKPQYVEELAARFDLAPSTISFHLKKLEQANLVYKVKDQYYTIFHVNWSIFDVSLKELISFENIEILIQEERLQAYENKVLKVFFKDDRLLRIPAQHKKRMIVYRFFANQIQSGRRYSEQAINDLILPYFDDYCTIRRALIDERLLVREGQIYWKPESIN